MKFTNFHKCNTEFKYRTFYYTVRVCRGLRFHIHEFSQVKFQHSISNLPSASSEARFFRNEPFLKGQCHDIVDPLSICWRIFWIWFQFCGDTVFAYAKKLCGIIRHHISQVHKIFDTVFYILKLTWALWFIV